MACLRRVHHHLRVDLDATLTDVVLCLQELLGHVVACLIVVAAQSRRGVTSLRSQCPRFSLEFCLLPCAMSSCRFVWAMKVL